jgi:hypothetical protein
LFDRQHEDLAVADLPSPRRRCQQTAPARLQDSSHR